MDKRFVKIMPFTPLWTTFFKIVKSSSSVIEVGYFLTNRYSKLLVNLTPLMVDLH